MFNNFLKKKYFTVQLLSICKYSKKTDFQVNTTIEKLEIHRTSNRKLNEKLEKSALTDTFGRYHTYLRISLSEKCNLRYNQNLTFFKCCSSFKTIFGNLTYLKFKTQFRSMDLNTIRFISSTPVNREKNEFQVIPNLSHVDSEGKAKMVDVSDKDSTQRIAEATATVFVGPVISKLIQENGILKGDVLSLAEIAGVLGAKKTSELIPLCHNIFLSVVQVKAEINPHNTNEITLYAIVKCHGKTGVEMEALTAVSIASLTIYDMCKAVSHEIEIKCIKLLSKSGGKRSYRKS